MHSGYNLSGIYINRFCEKLTEINSWPIFFQTVPKGALLVDELQLTFGKLLVVVEVSSSSHCSTLRMDHRVVGTMYYCSNGLYLKCTAQVQCREPLGNNHFATPWDLLVYCGIYFLAVTAARPLEAILLLLKPDYCTYERDPYEIDPNRNPWVSLVESIDVHPKHSKCCLRYWRLSP